MQADHADTERALAFVAMSVEDKHHLAAGVVKRKRTKRPRHHAAPASSSESTTTEEEDMAHCLILLAQGAAVVDSKPSTPAPAPPPEQPPVLAEPAPPPPPVVIKSERYTSRKYTEAATTADGVRAGFYVYECKTCNKCFPTFQALGGHRASHKKPRLAGADEDNANANANTVTNTNAVVVKSKPPSPPPPQADAAAAAAPISSVVVPDVTTVLSLNNVAAGSMINKLRVHECSICGAEFGSGQALGGHMRRHRPLHAPPERAVTTATTAPADTKKEGSTSINLELDLNLPAPSDEESVSPPPPPPPPPVLLALGGQFNDGKKPILQLTASAALVGCHY